MQLAHDAVFHLILPLKGRKVLVTRTREGNRELRKKLEDLGAAVVEIPAIEISEPSDARPITTALKELESFDWIVFTSANGVRAFFGKLVKQGKDRKEIRAKIGCVGSKTQKVLEDYGYSVDCVPKEFLTEELGRAMTANYDLVKKKVLLARAERAGETIRKILEGAGAEVVEAPVYKTTLPRSSIDKMDLGSKLDGVTDLVLTSPSTAEALVSIFGPEEINSKRIRTHCIGPVTAARARELGLEVHTVASPHTIEGLVHSICHDDDGRGGAPSVAR